ncbi:uncharacterized protein LOC135469626 [Liolophura sinensis]|uniref:uncharacterized protein LOC135469626 n=1 Tax=Liolophura sinensis TaxID=3198878 RepID=UPI00315980B5
MVLKSGDISWLLLRLILLIPTSLVWSAVLDDYPQRNMVAFFNGGCEEHICEYKCIPWNGGYVCRCPEGKILKSNGFSCHDVPNLESKSTRTPLPTTDKNVLPQRDEVYIEGGLLADMIADQVLSDEISAKPSLKSSTNLSSDKPVNSTVFKNVTTYRDGSPQNQTSYGVKIQHTICAVECLVQWKLAKLTKSLNCMFAMTTKLPWKKFIPN